MRRSIIFTRRRTRRRPICGCGAIWSVTTVSRTARNPTPAPRIGGPICRAKAFARCATGNGSAHSRAKPSGGRSASTPASGDGIDYEVIFPAGESVTLWWGLFDQELYVEHGEQRFGPFGPIGGPIPLHRYRSFKKVRANERIGRIETLAARLGLPRAALEGRTACASAGGPTSPPSAFRRSRSIPGACALPA